MLAAVLVYGQFRTAGEYTEPGGRVALVQGSIDTQMKSDPTKDKENFDHYWQRSYRAVRRYGKVDLIVWPETMFPCPVVHP